MDGEPSSLWYLAGGLLLAKGMSRDTSDEGAPRTAATQNIAKLKAHAATCAILGESLKHGESHGDNMRYYAIMRSLRWSCSRWSLHLPWIHGDWVPRQNGNILVAFNLEANLDLWGRNTECQLIYLIYWVLRLRPCQKHHGQPVQSNYGKKSCSIWFND